MPYDGSHVLAKLLFHKLVLSFVLPDKKKKVAGNYPLIVLQVMAHARLRGVAGNSWPLVEFEALAKKFQSGLAMNTHEGRELSQMLAVATTDAAALVRHDASVQISAAAEAVAEAVLPARTITICAKQAGQPRPELNDCSMNLRTLCRPPFSPGVKLTQGLASTDDVESATGVLLAQLQLSDYTKLAHAPGSTASAAPYSPDLPFEIASTVPEASRGVGAAMVQRMAVDMKLSAEAVSHAKEWRLIGFAHAEVEALRSAFCPAGSGASAGGGVSLAVGQCTPKAADIVFNGLQAMARLRQRLVRCRRNDEGVIAFMVPALESAANNVYEDMKKSLTPGGRQRRGNRRQRLDFVLQRNAGTRAPISFDFMTGALLSRHAVQELQRLNPFLPNADAEALLTSAAGVLLVTSRLQHTSRCLVTVDSLVDQLQCLVTRVVTTRWHADHPQHLQLPSELIDVAVRGAGFHPIRALAAVEHLARVAGRVARTVQPSVRVAAAASAPAPHPSSSSSASASASSSPSLPSSESKGDDGVGVGVGVDVGAAGAAAHAGLRDAYLLLTASEWDEDKAVALARGAAVVATLRDLARRRCFYQSRALPQVSALAPDAALSDAMTQQDARAVIHVLHHSANAVASSLQTQRHYFDRVGDSSADNPAFSYDPRFLVFEYLLGFVLRKAQVSMVNDFLAILKAGDSCVRQMIMGAGKTSVVAPLLALMLANGSQLVTQVMPANLLPQSVQLMRQRFSSVIVKRIYTLNFTRADDQFKGGEYVQHLRALRSKLDQARMERAVVMTTPGAIKSVVLKYLDLLQSIEAADDRVFLPDSELASERDAKLRLLREEYRTKSQAADVLRDIMELWGKKHKGILLLDEVDILLHPLRSELNFPINHRVQLDHSPFRWNMPIFILDGIFYATRGRLALANYTLSDELRAVLDALRHSIRAGVEAAAFQAKPHLVLLSDKYYEEAVKPHVAKWALEFLKSMHSIQADFCEGGVSKEAMAAAESPRPAGKVDDTSGAPGQEEEAGGAAERKMAELLDSDSSDWGGDSDAGGGGGGGGAHMTQVVTRKSSFADRQEREQTKSVIAPAPVSVKFKPGAEEHLLQWLEGARHDSPSGRWLGEPGRTSGTSWKHLNLGRSWVQTFVPHVLARINRVSYGILNAQDVLRWGPGYLDSMPQSRRVLVVPFEAKDVPSKTSEFAHPEVVIGLTIMSYRYQGLRKKDVAKVLGQLKKDIQAESGPARERPSRRRFNTWLQLGWSLHVQERKARGDDHPDGDDEDETGNISVATGAGFDILPLELFQPADAKQLDRAYEALRMVPEVVLYFLENFVFPSPVMRHQELKITACGVDLGSDMLFHSRVGFSGTPSDLLPRCLQPCRVERGSDAKFIRVLGSPEYVQATVPDSWSVESLLRWVATHTPRFHALIDTGALVTGMENREVAAFLLAHLPDDIDGCVYLDHHDHKTVLLRTSQQPVPLAECGLPWHRRFTFYDQACGGACGTSWLI